MAFTSGQLDDIPGVGMKQGESAYCRIGWFKNTLGSTGGAIDTLFETCYMMFLQIHANAVGNGPVYNTGDVEVALSGAIATIVTDADAVGRWIAWGA